MSDFKGSKSKFRSHLLRWYAEFGRTLPWVGERDPYRIWLSEVLLQQTRVDQGLPYYLNFIRTYPSVFDLAAAPESEVMKLWEGLGYYNRARNMLATARYLAERDGVFPETPEGLQKLKGIGPYTASAIASFAFGYPAAVVDGNVYRVLSRVFGIAASPDLPAGKKEFAGLADDLLVKDEPATWNQAMMDFGSLVCTPSRPACDTCPMQTFCHAYQHGQQAAFPVRTKKAPRKQRYFHYLAIRDQERWLLHKRPAGDFWEGLHEFPLVESDRERNWAWLCREIGWEKGLELTPTLYGPFKQQLTHREVLATVFFLEDIQVEDAWWPQAFWVSSNGLSELAFPVLVRRIFSEIT